VENPQKAIIELPMNRVEGDLELRVAAADGVVTDAWVVAPMFRGFERLLVGRGAMDGLVITPRICGMCNMSHLSAAAAALDAIGGGSLPDNARRLRNVVLMAENVQSDMRHTFLLFAPDLVNQTYAGQSLHAEALRRYEPLKGETAVQVIQETKHLLELVALLGGQWPNSAFMVPGGVSSCPGPSELLQCRHVVKRFRNWYEQRVLGCNLERWSALRSADDFESWLDESEAHAKAEVGFFIRFAREAGLDRIGKGHGNFISYGSLPLPSSTWVTAPRGGWLVAPGFRGPAGSQEMDHQKIGEHVACSWFRDYPGARHPSEGETNPYASGGEAGKYSWAKAPRFDGMPAETGPLSEKVTAGDPLFEALLTRAGGPNVMLRQLARMTRPAMLLSALETWLAEMTKTPGAFYERPPELTDGTGVGMVMAARGALGHWVSIENGRISSYQIVTPTSWNGSPRDSAGTRGPIEEALVGTPMRDPDNPVELGHVVRSFDPCMVCCVHVYRNGRLNAKVRV
jgi:hydrogenase large subunit